MRFTSMSNIGGQMINQDFFARVCSGGIYCFAMADGEGPGGELSAEAAVNAIINEFEKNPSMMSETVEGYMGIAQEAAEKVCKDELCSEAHSSAAVLITNGEAALIAHIGDVRIYKFEKGTIDFITADHTDVMEKYEAGIIQFGNIRREKSKLLRSLGTEKACAEIETAMPIKAKTAFLICTKGFWKSIDEDKMEECIKSSSSSKDWLGKMMKLMDGALPHDCDNMSAAAIIM